MAVELALTPDRRWDVTAAELAVAAGAAGFSAAGVLADRVDRAAADAHAAAGIRCHEILALVVSDDEAATVGAAEQLATAAELMGADWVLTVFASAVTPRVTSIVERCATIFARAGAGMAVEFSPLGPVATIPQAMELVRIGNRGGGRAGLMIDSWHFCVGASTWDDLGRVPLDDISYLQFADALAPESDSLGRETMHRRALPGGGVLELDRFAGTLLDRGFAGLVSAEVLSADLRALRTDELVRRIHDAVAPYWR